MDKQRRKTALITGASEGIGREMAKLFAADGYCVVLVARDRGRLEELAREIESRWSVQVIVLPKDLRHPLAPGEILAALEKDGLEVDVLVNNAGYAEYGKFAQIDLQKDLDMIQVMLVALTELSKRLLPAMLARGSGGILNVASTAALSPCPNLAVYAAIKAYVANFSQALAMECNGTGVTVSALLPGNTRSAFAKRAGMTKTPVVRFFPMTAESVAHIGYRAFKRGRRKIVAGCLNNLQFAFMPFFPRCLTERMTRFYLGA